MCISWISVFLCGHLAYRDVAQIVVSVLPGLTLLTRGLTEEFTLIPFWPQQRVLAGIKLISCSKMILAPSKALKFE